MPLPDLTLQALREFWSRHRHPYLIFPNTNGSLETIQKAKSHMDKGGAQNAMKTVVTEKDSLTAINDLINSLHVDLKKV